MHIGWVQLYHINELNQDVWKQIVWYIFVSILVKGCWKLRCMFTYSIVINMFIVKIILRTPYFNENFSHRVTETIWNHYELVVIVTVYIQWLNCAHYIYGRSVVPYYTDNIVMRPASKWQCILWAYCFLCAIISFEFQTVCQVQV